MIEIHIITYAIIIPNCHMRCLPFCVFLFTKMLQQNMFHYNFAFLNNMQMVCKIKGFFNGGMIFYDKIKVRCQRTARLFIILKTTIGLEGPPSVHNRSRGPSI